MIIDFNQTDKDNIEKLCDFIMSESGSIENLIVLEKNKETNLVKVYYTDMDKMNMIGYIELIKKHLLDSMES